MKSSVFIVSSISLFYMVRTNMLYNQSIRQYD